MRPPIRVTTATQFGTSFTSPLLTFLEGIVTEIDFNSVPVGTTIDTHYTAEGVTLKLISTTGAGGVVTANTASVADPDDPKGSASNVIGGFKDDQAIIRATFKHPQIYVAIDARPEVVSTEFFTPAESDSKPFLNIFGLPSVLPHHKPPLLATIPFPLMATDSNFESWQTMDFLSTSSTPNIGSIEFSCHFTGSGAPVNGFFDLLRFAHHLPLSAVDDVG